MGSVDNNGICASLHQGVHTVHHIGGNAHAGGHTETALAVLAGQRALFGLHDVAIGNQTHENTFSVHHGQLFNLMTLKNLGSFGKGCAHMSGDKVGNHDFLQRALHVLLKAQVAVGHHAYQFAMLVNNGDATDAVLAHEAECILHQGILGKGNRIDNHAVLGSFHFAHLIGLAFDGHILMQHTDTTFLSHSNGHGGFGHRVHGCRYQRHVQLDVPRKPCGHGHLAGENLGIRRHQQHIVISKAFANEFCGICVHNNYKLCFILLFEKLCKDTHFFRHR